MFAHDSAAGSEGRLDRVEMNAVREVVTAPQQHDDLRVRGACASKGIAQPAALPGAHRTVVEVEGEIADAVSFRIHDVAEGPMVVGVGRRDRTFGNALEPRAQHLCGRELDAGIRAEALRLQVADPERAVHRADADGSLALREELAGSAAQTILFVRAVQVDLLAEQRRIENAGTAVGRADPPDDPGRRVAGPVDGAVGLFHGRPERAPDIGAAVVEGFRLETAALVSRERRQHAGHGGLGHGAAIDAALGGGSSAAETPPRPRSAPHPSPRRPAGSSRPTTARRARSPSRATMAPGRP